MRLIDADELIKEVNENIELFEKERVYLEGLLLNAPTVDIKDIYQEGYYNGHLEGYTKAINEERPQGEWELHGMIYYCSKCGHECGESGDNFCGNCGADMRGDKE